MSKFNWIDLGEGSLALQVKDGWIVKSANSLVFFADPEHTSFIEPEPTPEPLPEPTPEPLPEPIEPPTPEPIPTPIQEPIPAPEPSNEVWVDAIANGQISPEWREYSWSATKQQFPTHLRVSLNAWSGFNLNGPSRLFSDYDQVEIDFNHVSGDRNIGLNIVSDTTDRQVFPLQNIDNKGLFQLTSVGDFTNLTIKAGAGDSKVFDIRNLRIRKKEQSTPAPVDPTPTPIPTPTPQPTTGNWLKTVGNAIQNSDGTVWQGRGVNIFDNRSCRACTGVPIAQSVGEIVRKIDFAISSIGANFFRLCLDSWNGFPNISSDATYLAAVKQIVAHIGTKGCKVMVSNWIDPTFASGGVPTADTANLMRIFVREFANDSHVLFGISNEPEGNWDSSQNRTRWTAFNDCVAAIRDEEARIGCPSHIVAVQGLAGWARNLSYYITNPITAGNGRDVVYETHVYNEARDFSNLISTPASTLPVIIGEFGPINEPGIATMTLADCEAMMTLADSLKVSYLAWSLHSACPPNLLVQTGVNSCGIGSTLQLTEWATTLANHLL